MITVRETLMSLATTDAERELLKLWMDEDSDPYSARRRAWQEVSRRKGLGMTERRLYW
ncbi:MAG: hypothetical protein ACC642_07375 [Pseudomonadales bacterium]